MKIIRLSLLMLMLIGGTVFAACSSNGKEPLSPIDGDSPLSACAISDEHHALWGMWDIAIDLTRLTATPRLLRNVQAHYDITLNILPPACDDCLKWNILGFNPSTHILNVDVTLRNPYAISGRDVRGILYTNSAGHLLVNADSWTGLYDIAGGDTINPFKAFAKAEVNRTFAGLAEHTENYRVYIPTPPQYAAVKFAVDASWPGNCKEPYSIQNFTQGILYNTGDEQAMITVDVHDWQNDVNKVTLAAANITGQSFMQLYKVSGDTWGLYIKNSAGASPGQHRIRFIATSTDSGATPLYHYVDLTITEWGTPSDPVDITPDYLNFNPQDVWVEGDIAYVAGSLHGLHAFDISDPTKPVWLSRAQTANYAYDVVVNGDHAFVADLYSGLEIYDIPSPGTMNYSKTIYNGGESHSLIVKNGYAYIADGSVGLTIIDIDPIETASVVKTVDTPNRAIGVAVSDDYAYVADYQGGLQIIDINPIGSAGIVKNVTFSEACQNVVYANGYVYAAVWGSSLAIVDVEPVGSAYVEKYVYMSGPMDLVESSGYVYVACGRCLRIVDVDPPNTASVVGLLNFRGYAVGLMLKDGYAFIANAESGLDVVDVSNVCFPQPVCTAFTVGNVFDVTAYGDYVYVCNWMGGFNIIDNHDPYTPQIIKVIDTPECARACKVLNGYAYVAASSGNFYIVDIDPVESANIVKTVTGISSIDLVLDGGYAYVASSGAGLTIVDIDPIGSAYVVKTVDTPGNAGGVAVGGGYAYIADGTSGLQVIDINPLGSASIVHSVAMPDEAIAVALAGNYVYVADFFAGLAIVDVTSPTSASIVKTVDTDGRAEDVVVAGDYAYVADNNRFTIIDINPVNSAYVYLSMTPRGGGTSVDVKDNYAYLGHEVNENGSLSIIRLW